MKPRTSSNPASALLAAVVALILPASAELLVHEPFAYTSTELTGQGGALGTNGAWTSWDNFAGASWALHQEGVLSGVVLSDTTTPSSFDGTVDNLPTSGGYVGFNQGGNNLNADIGLLPSVTASFQPGTTTWISYVSAWAWNLNAEHPNLVLGSGPAPTGSRGDNYGGIGAGFSGFGTGGGPTRNNRTDIYPMFYDAGQYSNVNGAIPGNAYNQAAFEVSPADGLVWQQADTSGAFGAPNIVIMKIEWDADTGGEDIISVASFLEGDTLSEANFDAMISSKLNLSSANWAAANKPDLTQGDLNTITFMGIKYFVDEIRLGTTFADIISEVVPPIIPFELAVNANGANLDFAWPSSDGNFYNFYSSTDLTLPLANWTLVEGDIPATASTNTKSIAQPGTDTFFYVEEYTPAPLLDADFEASDDGFIVKAGGTGSIWTRGAPDSSGFGGTIDGGAGIPASAECWGTNLGAFNGGVGDAGNYLDPTVTCLRSPVIDLTTVTAANLTFWHALDAYTIGSTDNDMMVVNIIDDTTDTIISPDIVPINELDDGSAFWLEVGPVALPVGQAIRIEWCFTGFGGPDDDYLGWYLDRVRVVLASP